MSLSYEERRTEVNDAIASGSMGCPFATKAAQNGEIMYCPSPRIIHENRPSATYIAGITEFARTKAANILIALPDTDSPIDREECRLYSDLLFPETVSSMQFATQNMIDILFADGQEDNEHLYEIMQMNPNMNRRNLFALWNQHRNMLSQMPSGPSGAYLLRRLSGQMEEMFPFVIPTNNAAQPPALESAFRAHYELSLRFAGTEKNFASTAFRYPSMDASSDWHR